MANRLADAVSPYLRSHASNPVDWWPWSPEAFAEAGRLDRPVLVSIGYATCHWCHVMARESFGDPALAEYLNAHFVSVKVDREEHPEVDASYLAAASAFTPDLGWPLNVFVTPQGRAFYAGTYFPPAPLGGRPSFRQVLEAVQEAWTGRRREVEDSATLVAEAIAATRSRGKGATRLPSAPEISAAALRVLESEDREFGGFGGAPKFPMAPLLGFLLEVPEGRDAARRALRAMAGSALRDPVDGGFFRYATKRDWSVPHYERMLTDNALLLGCYTTAWSSADEPAAEWAAEAAEGIARFLVSVLQRGEGGFGSAQDSESVVDGRRQEGEYYRRDRDARRTLEPPGCDEKVVTGWNGMAIGALAGAGFVFDREEWVGAARRAAEAVLARHREDGRLIRVSAGGRASNAPATLDDYGGLAEGLLTLALATGEVRFASEARAVLDEILPRAEAPGPPGADPFAVPGGGDPVLAAQGATVGSDSSDGAVPSGLALAARACYRMFLVSGDHRYRLGAEEAVGALTADGSDQPAAHGAALRLAHELAAGPTQLLLVTSGAEEGSGLGVRSGPDAVLGSDAGPRSGAGSGSDAGPRSELTALVRRVPAQVVSIVTDDQAAAFAAAGFELFSGRTAGGGAAAYYCRDFRCSLPARSAAQLRAVVDGSV